MPQKNMPHMPPMPQMRRKDRALDNAASLALLQSGEYGVLATVDAEGQPYGVPISYVLLDDKIYFHSAKKGHKMDNIENNAKVSFTVVGAVEAVYDKSFSSYYESVVVFGEVSHVEEPEEKIKSLRALSEKHLPEHMDKFDDSINSFLKITAVFSIPVDNLTGKAKNKK